jgi:hypothetical protein
MTILLDVFVKDKGERPTYIATGFENKFAEEQRSEGREPWVDLNFSRKVGDKRVKAVAIVYEDGSEISLEGKWPKLGFRKDYTLALASEFEPETGTYDDGESADEDTIDTDSL